MERWGLRCALPVRLHVYPALLDVPGKLVQAREVHQLRGLKRRTDVVVPPPDHPRSLEKAIQAWSSGLQAVIP